VPTGSIWNVNWLVENTQRPYPLIFGPAAVDTTGTVSIPEDFLVQMQITASYNFDPTGFYIGSIASVGTGFIVTLKHALFVAFSLSITIPSTTADFDSFQFSSDSDQLTGSLTIGTLSSIAQWPAGVWTFLPAVATLESDVARPTLASLNRLYVRNGDTLSAPLTGYVVLDAGPNIRLTTAVTSTGNLVTISAGSNPNYTQSCVCGNGEPTQGIISINGQTGDSNGNFNIIGKGCYQFTPVANGIEITNTCTDPCCTCDQLEGVLKDVRDFGNGAASLEQYLVKIGEALERLQFVTQLNNTVITPCDS
jgi:hypothetical protein